MPKKRSVRPSVKMKLTELKSGMIRSASPALTEGAALKPAKIVSRIVFKFRFRVAFIAPSLCCCSNPAFVFGTDYF